MTDPSARHSASSTGSIPKLRFPMHLKRRKKYRLRRRNYTFQPDTSPSGAVSADATRLAQLERDLAEARQALEQSEERNLRARSDMENLRRRSQKEREDLRKYAIEDLMRAIIPAMDHFGLAAKSLEAAVDIDSVRQGVTMIHRELEGTLQQAGLTIIEPGTVPFDPSLHEAVGTEKDESKPDGHITTLMRPGWSLNGRVLRPALVKVNKLQATETGNTSVVE